MIAATTIANWQLLSFIALILLSSFASWKLALGLGKDLWWGACRTYTQLMLMGFVLTYVFKTSHPLITLGLFTWMIFWASRIISGRIKHKPFPLQLPIFTTMAITYISITAITVGGFLQNDPWYNPVVFITIGGMVIGNSMNAVAISLERLFSDLREKRFEVEQRLLFGADFKQASAPLLRDAIRAGMIPSINSLMGVGLVFIPGMMTGQILGGEDPVNAARYQILIMLLVSASTAIGCSAITLYMLKKCFNKDQQIKPEV
jgi:putative ABC transport system permease protein